MYIALNPQKAKQFTTKGVHLSLAKPVMFIAEDLEPEFREKIDEAIRNQILYVVSDNEANGLIMPGIGSTGGVKTEEKSLGNYTVRRDATDDEIQEVKDPFGTVRRTRKIMYTLTLPKEEEPESRIILTDRS
ncbi:MAG: hypothetical protein E4H01_00080 [Lysobacterales bacterium]|nr:MAG: hypothetical protein E4H01_00080 [Xanthomonadales bacterium]